MHHNGHQNNRGVFGFKWLLNWEKIWNIQRGTTWTLLNPIRRISSKNIVDASKKWWFWFQSSPYGESKILNWQLKTEISITFWEFFEFGLYETMSQNYQKTAQVLQIKITNENLDSRKNFLSWPFLRELAIFKINLWDDVFHSEKSTFYNLLADETKCTSGC